ncbi:MAG: recombination mediator RecR [Holosporales bacterium]|jgi:recombination protein RecR|nr:recombination mediator RecR [Holosporales bacterium]
MYNGDIEKLISCFSRLPGFGYRMATRVVLHLLKKKHTVMSSFVKLLANVYENSKVCEVCGNVDVKPVCSICLNNKRDDSTICIVTDVADLWSIEKIGFFRGRYHVLGNKLSAIDGITPEDLSIAKLYERIKSSSSINEVIIAMSADIDGQTTMFFVKDKIKDLNIKITTLSHGVPIGSELESLDDGTIIAAFNHRRDI